MMHSVAQAARKKLTLCPALQELTQQMLQLGVPPDEVARFMQTSVDESIERVQLASWHAARRFGSVLLGPHPSRWALLPPLRGCLCS